MNLTRFYDRAMDYDSYLNILGENLDLHRLHYSKYQVSNVLQNQINKIRGQKILVITEPWCGDSLAILPVIRKIVESAPDWEIKVILRDENPDLMEHFLTNGSRAIPILIFLDDQDRDLFRFGPRPEAARDIFETFRRDIHEGKIDKPKVIKMIRTFYAKDRGRAIESELSTLVKQHFYRKSAAIDALNLA